MPHDYTYGSTVYKKGWMVWHSLRGYLGEEVFYSALQRLMNSCAFGNIDSYRLRDSLSLYTGVDLTDFFDFHVFSPGFVDYHVDLIPGDHPAVNIRQQTVGTTATPRGSMVPVTIFGTGYLLPKRDFCLNPGPECIEIGKRVSYDEGIMGQTHGEMTRYWHKWFVESYAKLEAEFLPQVKKRD
jgi:hypothetical protein